MIHNAGSRSSRNGLVGIASRWRRTERGGALTIDNEVNAEWYAIWTRSHYEQLVADQLTAKGLRVFLPRMGQWSRRDGVRRLIHVPMFTGYVFLHAPIDKNIYLDVIKARGVVRILGDRWDSLSTIDRDEIEALERVVEAGLPVMPHAYLREGQRVRIKAGPLKGVEGTLVDNVADKGVIVLSIELLQRSVAVKVDCTWVTAA